MNYEELTSTISELTDSLSRTVPDPSWSTVIHFVEHGEPEEAIDLMVAMVVKIPVPLTPTQHNCVRALMNHFEFTDESRRYYRYLSVPEMLDRMTVVDEPLS